MSKLLIACSLTILLSTGLLLAHGDATHIMGTVSAVQGDHVTVKLQDGKTEMVMFTKTTKYLSGAKAATKADLKVGSRGTMLNGKKVDLGSYYGEATGIVGLRLFANPEFDEKAAARWNAEDYYTKPDYYNDKDLDRKSTRLNSSH